MSSMWRKTMVYLGLVEEHDDYETFSEEIVERPERLDPEPESSNVRPLQRPEPGGAHVRPTAGLGVRVQVVAVSDYDQGASEIGRQFRMGSPVLFDMAEAETSVARRVLDFVAGVTFATRGRMDKVGPRAFLILPEGVDLPLSERERIAGMGYGAAR